MLNRYTEEYILEERTKDSGFYKKDPATEELLYGRFYVLNKDYELWREHKDTYTYPVDGWSWYESEQQARTVLNVPVITPPGQSNGN